MVNAPHRRATAAWGLMLLLLCGGALASSAEQPVLQVGAQNMSRAQVEYAIQRSATSLPVGWQAHDARSFLEQGLIPQLLLAQAAQDQHLLDDPSVRTRRDQLLTVALQEDLAKQIAPTIDDAQIRRYFEQHSAEFSVPEALLIWRIEVNSPDEAKEIVGRCQGADGVERWKSLAQRRRPASAEATESIGAFVRPDGTTDDPTVQLSPAIYAAVIRAADGQILEHAVSDGQHNWVIWRRGHRPGHSATLSEVSATVRQRLLKERVDSATASLVQQLRSKAVTDFHHQWIEQVPKLHHKEQPIDAFPPLRQ
ncbi:MAG TPA: peptidylprolyl isomerase [Polyangiaceae bacterium]|nr:peptidylprolyl isomerase [Polyangiaceae bacterium]